MRFLAPVLSILLIPTMAVLPLNGQLPAPLPANGTPAPSTFTLQVVSAEANGLMVELKDGSGAAVGNAAVVFRLPDSDPSGTFADGTRSAIAYTDQSGHAQSGAIHWSDGPGTVDVRITAAQGAAHAGLLYQHTPAAAVPVVVVPAPVVVATTPAPAARLTPGVLPAAKAAPGVVVETVAAKPAHRRPIPVATADRDDEDAATTSDAALDDDSPDANVPLRHAIRTGAAEGDAPGVSVTSAGSDVPSGHSKKKWIIALAAAAGAGAAIALLHMKSGSSSAASGTSIGSPSISIGHP